MCKGIRACQDVFGYRVPQVAVFDATFHSTMPPKSYTVLIHMNIMKYAVRRYGFHGTSINMSAIAVQRSMGEIEIKTITCHLGNGSSITAVQDGHVLIPLWV